MVGGSDLRHDCYSIAVAVALGLGSRWCVELLRARQILYVTRFADPTDLLDEVYIVDVLFASSVSKPMKDDDWTTKELIVKDNYYPYECRHLA